MGMLDWRGGRTILGGEEAFIGGVGGHGLKGIVEDYVVLGGDSSCDWVEDEWHKGGVRG